MLAVVVSRKKTKGNEKQWEKIRIKLGKEKQRSKYPSRSPRDGCYLQIGSAACRKAD